MSDEYWVKTSDLMKDPATLVAGVPNVLIEREGHHSIGVSSANGDRGYWVNQLANAEREGLRELANGSLPLMFRSRLSEVLRPQQRHPLCGATLDQLLSSTKPYFSKAEGGSIEFYDTHLRFQWSFNPFALKNLSERNQTMFCRMLPDFWKDALKDKTPVYEHLGKRTKSYMTWKELQEAMSGPNRWMTPRPTTRDIIFPGTISSVPLLASTITLTVPNY